MSRHHRTGGFTLIELMIALALTGLAVSLVAGSVWATIETRERQARAVEADHRARVTRAFLREVVRGLALEREGRGELFVLGAAPTRLVVATRGGAVFGWEADLKAVELLVDEDSGTPQQGLVARVLRAAGGRAREDTLVLLPHATGLRVRMQDGGGTWGEEWPDPTHAPRVVEFRFDGSNGRLGSLPLQVAVP